MAKPIVNIKFLADLKQFSSQMQNANRSIAQVGKKMQDVGSGLTLGITTPLLGLGAVAVSSAAKLETLKTSLNTVFSGNSAAADKAFDKITNFASTTPFQVEQVADAFIKLKNFGLDPSERALTSYGNTASAMGKSLNQMIEAVADATTNEFERLKEFGVKSKQEGNKVSFTFKGVTTTVKKEAGAIQEYLLNLGETNFAGGMAAQSKTFTGQLSTLKDKLSLLSAEFGMIIIKSISPFIDKISSLADWFKKLSPETKNWVVAISGIAAAAGPVIVILGTIIRNINVLIPLIKSLSVVMAANPIGAVVTAVVALSSAFVLTQSRLTPLTNATKEFNDLTISAAKNIAEEKAQLEKYLSIAKDDNKSKKERESAIKSLNALSPKYLGDLSLETINTKAAVTATNNYVTALLTKAKVQAAEEKLVEVQKELLELQLGNTEAADPSVWQTLGNAFVSLGDKTKYSILQAGSLAKNLGIEGSELEVLQQKLLAFINTNEAFKTSVDGNPLNPVTPTAAGVVDGASGLSLDDEETLSENPLDGLEALITEDGQRIRDAVAEAGFDSMISDAVAADVEKLDEKTDAAVKAYEERMKSLAVIGEAAGSAVGDSFANLSNSLVGSLKLADHGLQGFIKSLIQGITKIIAALLSQSIASAIAGGTSAGASTGPAAVATIPAFVASLVAVVIGAFASIPKFETGGIVGGSSFYGDRILARVNSGEAIFNQDQQKSLYGLINNNASGEPTIIGGTIEASGDVLQVILDRASKSRNRRS